MRILLTQHTYLIAYTLQVDQDAIFYEIPFFALYTFVVISHSTKRTGLQLISDEVHCITSIFKIAGFHSVERDKAGAGIVCLITQHTIQFSWMSYGFVYREPH